MFVEIDWIGTAREPRNKPEAGGPDGGLIAVVEAFSNAPPSSFLGPLADGIGIFILSPGSADLVDDELPPTGSIRYNPTRTDIAADQDFQTLMHGKTGNSCDAAAVGPPVLEEGWFGTKADRTNPNCRAILAAKALMFRYAIFLELVIRAPPEDRNLEEVLVGQTSVTIHY